MFQVIQLRHAARISVLFSSFNAAWPTALWTVSLMCLLDETPSWLIEGLRRIEAHLPNVLAASLFLDPPALYPVCRLLSSVMVHEEARLTTCRRHAAGKWSLTKPTRAPLTDLDVATIIVRRLERLDYLRQRLDSLARSERAVPTAIGAPLLDKLRVEIEQLAKVLEADASPPPETRRRVFWWFATLISSEHRNLRRELDDAKRLGGRIAAVRFTAVAFAARGQAGVTVPGEEETAARRMIAKRWA